MALKTETRARLQLTGESPLVMNSARLADSADDYAIKIKALTDKGGKITPEEREQKEALQWRGSLYLSADGSLVFPARNIVRALTDAAKSYKAGALVERGAVLLPGIDLVFYHDGPAAKHVEGTSLRYGPVDLNAMYAAPVYQFRTVVNGNPTRGRAGGKVTTMRPVFPVWALTFDVAVFHDMLSWDKFQDILTAAGRQGIGNARLLGYGRFEAKATVL